MKTNRLAHGLFKTQSIEEEVRALVPTKEDCGKTQKRSPAKTAKRPHKEVTSQRWSWTCSLPGRRGSSVWKGPMCQCAVLYYGGLPDREGYRLSQYRRWFIKVPSPRQTYETRVDGSHFRCCELFCTNTSAVSQILLTTPQAKQVSENTIFLVLSPYRTLPCLSHTLHTFY